MERCGGGKREVYYLSSGSSRKRESKVHIKGTTLSKMQYKKISQN